MTLRLDGESLETEVTLDKVDGRTLHFTGCYQSRFEFTVGTLSGNDLALLRAWAWQIEGRFKLTLTVMPPHEITSTPEELRRR